MNRITQSYKRSPASNVSAGMKSIVRGTRKQYFILEHRVGSRYHYAGEQQEIIVDQIEIGRDETCQVRFDEVFETVSRRHAAISKVDNCWKLVPLSTTNPTLLNGKKVQQEWFLQHGDEIQCAINGPKLGFIIPSGEKAMVGSIGLSRRLHLFGKQVLAPYKRILIAVMCFLLLLIGVGVYFIVTKEKKINDYAETVHDLSDVIDNYSSKITNYQNQIDSMSDVLLQDKELQEQLNRQISRLHIDFERIRLETEDLRQVTEGWRPRLWQYSFPSSILNLPQTTSSFSIFNSPASNLRPPISGFRSPASDFLSPDSTSK